MVDIFLLVLLGTASSRNGCMLVTIESSNSHFSRETLTFADISAILGMKKEGLRLIIVGRMRQATD